MSSPKKGDNQTNLDEDTTVSVMPKESGDESDDIMVIATRKKQENKAGKVVEVKKSKVKKIEKSPQKEKTIKKVANINKERVKGENGSPEKLPQKEKIIKVGNVDKERVKGNNTSPEKLPQKKIIKVGNADKERAKGDNTSPEKLPPKEKVIKKVANIDKKRGKNKNASTEKSPRKEVISKTAAVDKKRIKNENSSPRKKRKNEGSTVDEPAAKRVANRKKKENTTNVEVSKKTNPLNEMKTAKGSAPQGWRRSVVKRQSGATAGKADIYYYNEDGRKFRSKPEVAKFLAETNSSIKIEEFNFSVKNMGSDKVPKAPKKPKKKKSGVKNEGRRPKGKGVVKVKLPLKPKKK